MSASDLARGAHTYLYASGAATDREEFARAVDADINFIKACLDEVQDMPVDTFEQTVARMVRFVKIMGRDITQVREDLGAFDAPQDHNLSG